MSYKAIPIKLFSEDNNVPEIETEIDLYNNIWLEMHSTNDELILNHYTTLDGLKGIITNRSIWCTQINALNDPFEFEYGKELIIKHLKEFIVREREPRIKSFLMDLIDFSGNAERLTTHDIFIACFCKEDNLLSQWRGYAAKGGGYNLGILLDSDTKISSDLNNLKDYKQVILRKIIYKQVEQDKIIELCITNLIRGMNNALSKWDTYIETYGPSIGAMIELSVHNLLIDLMLSIKSHYFEEEQEWRLIRIIRWDEIPEKYKFRENNNEFIPYLNTYIHMQDNDKHVFPLQKIRYGPMLDKLKTKKALDLFIKNSATFPHNIGLKKDIIIKDAGYVLRGTNNCKED